MTGSWLGDVPAALSEADGYAELVRRWLWTFGPGTEADIVWWLGATKTAVRRALSDIGAEPVTLDRNGNGWLFDSNRNAGNTAWWNGRIVGAWAQDHDAIVHVLLREDLGREATGLLEAEAARLTHWLDGVRITNVYASQQMKHTRLP